jgi:hypothetical protein
MSLGENGFRWKWVIFQWKCNYLSKGEQRRGLVCVWKEMTNEWEEGQNGAKNQKKEKKKSDYGIAKEGEKALIVF